MAPTPGARLKAVAPSTSPAPAGDPASHDDLAKRHIATPAAGLLDGPVTEQRPVLPGVNGDPSTCEGRYQARPWRGAALRFVA